MEAGTEVLMQFLELVRVFKEAGRNFVLCIC
jgi:hypothetical protein